MLHEALGYQVYAAAGVAVPETGYVRLTVNGQDRGLLNVETIDAHFLERRFGDSGGILYEGAYGVDLRRALRRNRSGRYRLVSAAEDWRGWEHDDGAGASRRPPLH